MQSRSIASCRSCVSVFFRWAATRQPDVSSITSSDIDEFLTRLRQEGFTAASVATVCQRLRTFFRYAEERGLSKLPVAADIRSPTLARFDPRPKGPRWTDVRKLLSRRNVKGYADFRARAVLCLCAIYGLRAGEVISLQLDSFDWREETFTIKRGKNGRVQRFPLQAEVGDAILDYLRESRPRCSVRSLFVSLSAPYRPLEHSGLRAIASTRMKALGIQSLRYGTHALRHSCATQLLHKGVSLENIADFLGHSNTNSVSVYAKCSASSIRKVSEFSLDDIL